MIYIYGKWVREKSERVCRKGHHEEEKHGTENREKQRKTEREWKVY